MAKWAKPVKRKNPLKDDPQTVVKTISLNAKHDAETDHHITRPEKKHNVPVLERLFKALHIPEKYRNNKAQFVDVISRLFFPAAFVVFNMVFWSYYN